MMGRPPTKSVRTRDDVQAESREGRRARVVGRTPTAGPPVKRRRYCSEACTRNESHGEFKGRSRPLTCTFAASPHPRSGSLTLAWIVVPRVCADGRMGAVQSH
jgi:hypothetical protein